MIEKRQFQPDRHDSDINKQGIKKTDIFPENEFVSMHRFGKQRIHGSLVQLLVDKPDSQKNGDEHPEDGNGCQAQIQDYLHLVSKAELAQQEGAEDDNQSKKNEVIENLIPDILSKCISGDNEYSIHNKT